MNRVFVYGSLKRGFHNHHLLEQATFLGLDKTKGLMLDLGSFPGLVQGNDNIYGEVFECDNNTFARLDRLEGHPHFYERQFQALESGQQAWVYLLKQQDLAWRQNPKIVASGTWNKA